MNRTKKLTAAALIIVTIVAAVFITNATLTHKAKNDEFYVGVTYCGTTVDEAKQLIDKVANYTNLFVLQSGSLMHNNKAVAEIGDYAVNAGLHYMLYFGTESTYTMTNWINNYDGHWNSSFVGFYFGDEQGGKMLDSERDFNYPSTAGQFRKYADASSQWPIEDNGYVYQSGNGTITLTEPLTTVRGHTLTAYYPNGTILLTTNIYTGDDSIGQPMYKSTTIMITDNSTLAYTYQELVNSSPCANSEKTANAFINATKYSLSNFPQTNYTVLTSDYGLYWYDYLGGYDVVLAQLGWNHTSMQDIALARGAANLQGKSWGTIVTWKYNQAPYLADGDEIYDQLKLSYECGAKYIVIFNYAENMNSAYGTLTEEHFTALQRFWNDKENGKLTQVKADTVFVLPPNYGSGLRNQGDINWGLWAANATDKQIYQHLENAVSVHGEKLDVVVENPGYLVAGKYSQVIYWNQTG